MLAKVSVCPFSDTEHLAETASKGTEPIEPIIRKHMDSLKAHGHGKIATELDDAFLSAITAAQNETIRNTICIHCDQNAACHPVAAC